MEEGREDQRQEREREREDRWGHWWVHHRFGGSHAIENFKMVGSTCRMLTQQWCQGRAKSTKRIVLTQPNICWWWTLSRWSIMCCIEIISRKDWFDPEKQKKNCGLTIPTWVKLNGERFNVVWTSMIKQTLNMQSVANIIIGCSTFWMTCLS